VKRRIKQREEQIESNSVKRIMKQRENESKVEQCKDESIAG
jgi:hypothetical protein